MRKFKVGDEAWAYSTRRIRHGIITSVMPDGLVRFKSDKSKYSETHGEDTLKSLAEMSDDEPGPVDGGRVIGSGIVLLPSVRKHMTDKIMDVFKSAFYTNIKGSYYGDSRYLAGVRKKIRRILNGSA